MEVATLLTLRNQGSGKLNFSIRRNTLVFKETLKLRRRVSESLSYL